MDGKDGAHWMSLPVNRHFPWLSEGFWTFPQRWGVGTACQKGFFILCHVHEVPHLLPTSSETINFMNSLNSRNRWNSEAKKRCSPRPLSSTHPSRWECSPLSTPWSKGRYILIWNPWNLKEKKEVRWYKIHETWQFRHGWLFFARPSQSSFLEATDGCERSIEDTESLKIKCILKMTSFSTLTRPCRVCSCTALLFPSPKSQGWQTHFG